MKLYKYQQRVDELLRSGRSVILQAPTGAGKTRAALFPFLDGWRNEDASLFPRQCIYAVPMRVLANQFEAEYREIVVDYTTRFGLLNKLAIQTGTRAEDRKLQSDLIFTTLDQALSSFLTIPYSLGIASANINAGAVVSSYLVFDEFHLFPVNQRGEGALTTTLLMLQMLKGLTPFVLMTATFSKTMIERLATLLDAEPLIVTGNLLDDIPSQQGKLRTFTRCERTLEAETVWQDFQQYTRQRVLVICNKVDRAQALGAQLQQLAKDSGVKVEVLHSRFFRADRDVKEDDIRREFGEDTRAHTWPRAILVATQVVEVGLNITCQALHTEVAPAAAIVQRAGRCARFANEAGDVFIYAAPLKPNGEPDYAPYLDEEQSDLCARTWEAVAGYQRRVLDFDDELALVEQVHRDHDTRMIDQLERNNYNLREKITIAWRDCDRSKGRDLIRHLDDRTVLIHPNPSHGTIPDPYAWDGISVRKGRLLRWWKEAQEFGRDLDWMVKYPVNPQPMQDIEQEGVWDTVYEWRALRWGDSSQELVPLDLLVINPALVSYDAKFGFRFKPGDPDYIQPEPDTASRKQRSDGPHTYQRETFEEHITQLYNVYRSKLRPQTAALQRRIAERLGLAGGVEALDRAIRLMLACHDIGKLDTRWQRWAHNWQRQLSTSDWRNDPSCLLDPDFMAAHTDCQDRKERLASSKIRPQRPKHAAESAWAAFDLLGVFSEGNVPLWRGLITAITRHHTATCEGDFGDFEAASGSRKNHYAAKKAFRDALVSVGMYDEVVRQSVKVRWKFRHSIDLCNNLSEATQTEQMLVYLILARILRLCDQGALESIRR